MPASATVVDTTALHRARLSGPFADHGARVVIAWDKAAPTLEKLRGTTSLETIISVNMIEAMPAFKQLALKLPIKKIKEQRDALSAPAPNTVPWEALIGSAIGGEGDDIESEPTVTKDTIALILYTSGTTGTPKGAQLTHGNLFANCSAGQELGAGSGEQHERMLAALPMFHAYGLTMVAPCPSTSAAR